METFFPYMDYDYNGNESISRKGYNVAKIVCTQLKERNYSEIKLAEIEEAYEQMAKDDPSALYSPFDD
jgi:hypothetical protein